MDQGEKKQLPLLALRGIVLFPRMVLHFDVGRDISIAALEYAMLHKQLIYLVAQRDVRKEDPGEEDIFKIGTVARIKQMMKLPNENNVRVLVEGLHRAQTVKFLQADKCLMAEIENCEVDIEPDVDTLALMKATLERFEHYGKISNKFSPELVEVLGAARFPGNFADIVAGNILSRVEDKQDILEKIQPVERLEALYHVLAREIEIAEAEKRVQQRVRRQIDKNQREYFLREQMKAIQKELGEGETAELDEYREKIKKAGMSVEAEEKALQEIKRLSYIHSSSPESAVIRTYLDWLLDVPWTDETEDNFHIGHARKVLQEDHYGLDKVKERVLEYLAVRRLSQNMKGPILCFVGPPGVGKTSVARSVARALDRKFIRFSLGGMRDEAEIRGHRRTYIGAIPGRIINAMKLAGVKNPVILLDEVDKLGNDFRGDPASALLEVLDSEQNFAFRDHYLEVPYDLSKAMFITTANTTDSIPKPLLDRMETIYINSYTEEEKFQIAKRYLVVRQMEQNGLKKGSLVIGEPTLRRIIEQYTREAGVRELERKMGTICRKAALEMLESKVPKTHVNVTLKNLQKYLGVPAYRRDQATGQGPGVATGLAWTALGGEVLYIEASMMAGTGKLELTGMMGDVMKESAKAALGYIRARSESLGLSADFYKDCDVHIHIPEGAIPKDGPSAGITMATALVSALSHKKVRSDVAMTGEMTLTGRVLPIGGLKEKALAAYRLGIDHVLIPKANEKDLEEIPDFVKEKIKFTLVETLEQVLQHAIGGDA